MQTRNIIKFKKTGKVLESGSLKAMTLGPDVSVSAMQKASLVDESRSTGQECTRERVDLDFSELMEGVLEDGVGGN